MSELQERGSGWSLKRILHLVVNINKYNYMRLASYIPLPKDIKDKKACINVNIDDNKCIMQPVLAGLYKDFKITQNYFHYKKYINSLNCDALYVMDVSILFNLKTNLMFMKGIVLQRTSVEYTYPLLVRIRFSNLRITTGKKGCLPLYTLTVRVC